MSREKCPFINLTFAVLNFVSFLRGTTTEKVYIKIFVRNKKDFFIFEKLFTLLKFYSVDFH